MMNNNTTPVNMLDQEYIDLVLQRTIDQIDENIKIVRELNDATTSKVFDNVADVEMNKLNDIISEMEDCVSQMTELTTPAETLKDTMSKIEFTGALK